MTWNPDSWKKGGGHLILTGLCLFLAIWAGRWGLAELYFFPLEKLLARIQDPKLSDEEREKAWEEAIRYNREALNLHPGNAEYWLQLGQFQYLWSRRVKDDAKKATDLLKEAAGSYEMAAKICPTWGYTWINLAQVKMVQGSQYWGEAAIHLERAMVFAPWESSVQRNAVRLGFILWGALDERMRSEVINVAIRAMASFPHEILELVKRYEKRESVQPLVRFQPKLRAEFDKYFGLVSSSDAEKGSLRP
ncbi:MAG: hypothetical protein HQL63_09625 [Magnetococcales bacterium]|nr:hypothetical protein [Magnetococcales bacterium]MBF0322215.1 hypothetical protein [Magnetococcales bacterium]